MRLFIALWPAAAERRLLLALAGGIGSPWRPNPAADLHLTLAFLGELPRARLPRLAAVLARQGAQAPLIVLDRLEAWGGGRLACAVGGCPPSLQAWQGRLLASLAAAGLVPGRHAFVPHVTLATRASPGTGGGQPRPAVAGPIRPAVRLACASLVLVESRPGVGHGDGPLGRYRVLMARQRPGSGPVGHPLAFGAKRTAFWAGAGGDMY
jgi:2'-5' RNA ligase